MAFKKLKKAIKRKWVEALRSGGYQQARNNLASGRADQPLKEQAFCCIGVGYAACRRNGLANVHRIGTSQAARSLGLNSKATDILVDLNDRKMWSFRRIATWVEKNL